MVFCDIKLIKLMLHTSKRGCKNHEPPALVTDLSHIYIDSYILIFTLISFCWFNIYFYLNK